MSPAYRQMRRSNVLAVPLIAMSMVSTFVPAAPAFAQTKVKDDGGGITNALPGCGVGGGEPIYPYSDPPPPEKKKFASSPGGVDMRSGSYSHESVDVSIGGEGDAGLTLVRSFSFNNGSWHFPYQPMGRFFTHNWDIQLREVRTPIAGACYPSQFDYNMTVMYGGLGESFHSVAANIAFEQTAPAGYAELTAAASPNNPKLFTFVARDGTVVTFLPLPAGVAASLCPGTVGRCTYAAQIVRPDKTIYTLEYDTLSDGLSKRLRAVVSNRGYAMLFEYGSGSWVTKTCVINLAVTPKPANFVCPVDARSATYSYSGDVQTTATDASSATTTFGTPSSTSFTLTRPGESTPFVTNGYAIVQNPDSDANLTVTSQAFVTGTSYTYNWDITTNVTDGGASYTQQVAGGKWTDANGKSVKVTYGAYPRNDANPPSPTVYVTPGPEIVTDELNRSTVSTYCTAAQQDNCFIPPVQKVTDPEGNSESYVYDYYRNITQVTRTPKPGSGLPNITEQRSFGSAYPTARAKPTSVTDGAGNVTSYTYDPTHGGVLTETLLAVAVNGSGSVQPVKRYEYTYRKAWISNGAGGYVQNADGVYLLSSEKTCRETATVSGGCAGGPGDEVVTSYDYGPDSGPNTLFLRGKVVTAGGVSLRTCFGYDGQGNKIWDTSPRAGLGSCS